MNTEIYMHCSGAITGTKDEWEQEGFDVEKINRCKDIKDYFIKLDDGDVNGH